MVFRCLGSGKSTVEDTSIGLSILHITDGGIVVKTHFGHFEFWIDRNFQDIITGIHFGDVDPLTVQVIGIDIGTVDGDTWEIEK